MPALLDIALRLPPGVTFTQWKDGSIHIRCVPEDVLKTRDLLEVLSKELTGMAIQQIEAEKKLEEERQRMPESKLKAFETELKRLRGELPEQPPVIEVPLPQVQISSVTFVPDTNGTPPGV